MSDWWDAIPVALTKDDMDCAWQFAKATAAKRAVGIHKSYQASTYWTPFEIDQYGHVCEHIAHRFTGQPLRSCVVSQSTRTDEADVGRWEVKGTPWRSVIHFHLSQGGRTPVPDHVRRPVLAVSYFLQRPMWGWVDGWLPWQEAIRWPRGGQIRGSSGQRARMIPYTALHAAQSIHEPSG